MSENAIKQFGINYFVSPFFHCKKNTFLNTRTNDSNCFIDIGDFFLTPIQYLFNAQFYQIEQTIDGLPRRIAEFKPIFDYNDSQFMQITKMIAALFLAIIGLAIGSFFKGIGLIGNVAKENQELVYAYMNASEIDHPTDYAALGIEGELYSNEEIECQGLPRPESDLEEIRTKLSLELRTVQTIMERMEEIGMPCWLECGTALGAYRHGGLIPWDKDIDIAILKKDHHNFKVALKNIFGNNIDIQDWSPHHFPGTSYKIYFKETGFLIDVYTYDIQPASNDDQNNGAAENFSEPEMLTLTINGQAEEYPKVDPDQVWNSDELQNEPTLHYQFSEATLMPESWKIRERECLRPKPLSSLFPLKKGTFDSVDESGQLISVKLAVPNQLEKWLQSMYGLLAPSKFYNATTGKYEAVAGHPYWIHHDPHNMLE